MIEVRCKGKGCSLLLGEFSGRGRIKCRKCGGINTFDTETGEHNFESGKRHTDLSERTTSSGVVFR
ncbi:MULTISPECIES: hypothetical protein [Lactonifactor]|uniref:Uncharacterized protein n=1 Tax=Lactonifactor longoviformis DSM 17459 TaxID=1122155 RepID=A0A1M5DDF7_9CLOT|nr:MULTISPECIES: hypothetical protein [Lactonifactor]SHF64956.1 hypothetical protein SAMN02745158_04504 [Lactonifactor longoviformis DSM 17459]